MKQVSSQKSKKPSSRTGLKIIAAIAGLLVLVVIIYVCIVQIQLRQEASTFMSLKQDFLALQTDFNKVNPGWEYSNECRGGGGPYDRNVAQSCSVYLSNEQFADNSTSQASIQRILSENDYISMDLKDGLKEVFYAYDKKYPKDIKCTLYLAKETTESTKASFRCHGDASRFYFPNPEAPSWMTSQ